MVSKFLRSKVVRFGAAMVLALSVLVAGGCGGSGGDSKDAGKQDQVGEAKFGSISALSGGGAVYSGWFKRGMDMAVEEINGAGGITVKGKKYMLKPIHEDSQGRTEVTASVGQRLVNQDKVPVILTGSSNDAFALMAFNQKKGSEFVLMGVSQSDKFTEQGNKLVVRICANAVVAMPEFVDRIFKFYDRKNIKYETFAIMQVNTETGSAWAGAFEKAVKAKGKKVVGTESYASNDTNFYNQLTNLISKNPDVIVLTTVTTTSSIAIKQARELGFKGNFINSAAANAAEHIKLAGSDTSKIENLVCETSIAGLGITPEVKATKEKILAKWKEEPNSVFYLSYDGTKIMARAMEIAGTVSDPVAIRAAMPQAFKDAKPVTAMKDLDEKGEILYPAFVMAVEGGKSVGYHE